MRIYIIGGISNFPDHVEQFAAAEYLWRSAGHELVLNPVHLHGNVEELKKTMTPEQLWKHCMKACIHVIMNNVDAVALLPTHFDSRGSNWELMCALFLGLPTFDALTFEPIDLGVKYTVIPGEKGICRVEDAGKIVDIVRRRLADG